jgi:hypothetical protein
MLIIATVMGLRYVAGLDRNVWSNHSVEYTRQYTSSLYVGTEERIVCIWNLFLKAQDSSEKRLNTGIVTHYSIGLQLALMQIMIIVQGNGVT